MKIKSNGKVKVLAKNSREGQNRQMYYNLAVLIEGEAGNMSCTEDAHLSAKVDSINNVTYEYNSEFKSFRIIDAYPDSDAGTKQTPAQEDKSGTKPDKSGK